METKYLGLRRCVLTLHLSLHISHHKAQSRNHGLVRKLLVEWRKESLGFTISKSMYLNQNYHGSIRSQQGSTTTQTNINSFFLRLSSCLNTVHCFACCFLQTNPLRSERMFYNLQNQIQPRLCLQLIIGNSRVKGLTKTIIFKCLTIKHERTSKSTVTYLNTFSYILSFACLQFDLLLLPLRPNSPEQLQDSIVWCLFIHTHIQVEELTCALKVAVHCSSSKSQSQRQCLVVFRPACVLILSPYPLHVQPYVQ